MQSGSADDVAAFPSVVSDFTHSDEYIDEDGDKEDLNEEQDEVEDV